MKVEGCSEHRICYIRLSNNKVSHSAEYKGMVVIDYDKDGNPVGIEFVDGLEKRK